MFDDDNSSAGIVSGSLEYSCLHPLLIQMPYYSVLIALLFIYELVSIWLDQFDFSLQPDLEFIYYICL